MDDDMRREADILNFFGRRPSEVQATLRTASGKLPVRVSAMDGQVHMFGVPKAVHPAESEALKAAFTRAALPDGWHDFSFDLQFEPQFLPS